MSNSSIMSLRDMIDMAFGDPKINKVDFKIMGAILFILARQLRLLERRIAVDFPLSKQMDDGTTLSVTEIKIQANVPKKKKKGETGIASDIIGKGSGKKYDVTKSGTHDKSSLDRQSTDTASGKKERDRISSSKEGKYKTSSDREVTDQTSSHKEFRTIGKTSSERDVAGGSRPSRDKDQSVRKVKRTDSLEEGVKSPTPMASLESTELQYEKLLVVERVPSDESGRGRSEGLRRSQQLSVVTTEQFEALVNEVILLKEKYGPVSRPDFPENIKLLEDLRKGASLTDAMAALQLSARLEAAEKMLEQTTLLLTDLASRSPEIAELPKTGVTGAIETGAMKQSKKGADTKSTVKIKSSASKTSITDVPILQQKGSYKETSSIASRPIASKIQSQVSVASDENTRKHGNYVSYEELDTAMRELKDDMHKTVTSITGRSNANAEAALKIANSIESKIEQSLNLGSKMEDLENLVSEYAVRINALDTGLSCQMTKYQEQLTQMQYDLESGLETMAEAIANQSGDPEAVAELNAHFTNLQLDFEITISIQKELKEVQEALALDLESLWKQIEVLRESKADRDEVADALRDKAGISALNGLVTLVQFDAVRGDFEKRIVNAYDSFNNQEITWQKAIDEIIRDLYDKADTAQVNSLMYEVKKNINILKDRMETMLEILGEPRSAALARQIHRDATCLSCSSPAYMALEEPGLIPSLPSARPSKIGAEAPAIARGEGDHGVCYPGFAVKHPVDPRARTCTRYCGGSHTKGPVLISRDHTLIKPLQRETATAVGSDGKTYLVDDEPPKPQTPCVPCNVPPSKSGPTISQEPLEVELAPTNGDYRGVFNSSDITPSDFRPSFALLLPAAEKETSLTPPPYKDD